MGTLTKNVLGLFYVDEQRIEEHMIIRRLDPISKEWYEGEVCRVAGGFNSPWRLSLNVEGYAPSPLAEGQTVEIVSNDELAQREIDQQNKIAWEHREKPWLPSYDGE